MKRITFERILVYLILSACAIIMALPFYYMVITSLKGQKEVTQPVISMVVSPADHRFVYRAA